MAIVGLIGVSVIELLVIILWSGGYVSVRETVCVCV